MIIFGTRGVTGTKGTGEFFCPRCADKRPFKHRRVRRFFTLYFIPLIPLDTLGEYIECDHCDGTYELTVLEFDPTANEAEFEAEFERAMKRVMVLMMLADGVVDPAEVQVVREVFGKIAGREIDEASVQSEIDAARADGLGVEEFTSGLVGSLNDNGKERVIRSAFLVAAADGEFQDEEQQLLSEIGKALQMTDSHLNGVLASMTSQA